MRKILFIALLLVCITARKHHKEEEGQGPEDPMGKCIEEHCQEQAFSCFFDDQCMKTFESCDEQFGEGITPDQLGECTSQDAVAQGFIQCIADNCSGERALMKVFQRRRQH